MGTVLGTVPTFGNRVVPILRNCQYYNNKSTTKKAATGSHYRSLAKSIYLRYTRWQAVGIDTKIFFETKYSKFKLLSEIVGAVYSN